MLDLGLVMQILVLGRLEKRRVEDLFLDGGVHLERIADVGRELELAVVGARFLELLEPLLDLAVIRLQQRNRVLPHLRLAWRFDFALAMISTPCLVACTLGACGGVGSKGSWRYV